MKLTTKNLLLRLRRFRIRPKQASVEDISSLERFVQNYHFGKDLSPQEARENIVTGMLETISKSKHRGNGLLITKNGYFITANHCVEDPFYRKVRTVEGKVYSLEKICAFSASQDLALAKIDLPGPAEPCIYRFRDRLDMEADQSMSGKLVMYTRKDGKVIGKLGKFKGYTKDVLALDRIYKSRKMSRLLDRFGVEIALDQKFMRSFDLDITHNNNNNNIKYLKEKDILSLKVGGRILEFKRLSNQFSTDINAIPGDSGGIVACLNKGELVGVITTGKMHSESLNYSDHFSTGADMTSALYLVSRYAAICRTKL